MTITYCRNDPVSSRWTGVGRLLTEFEVDYNFYQHENRITTLEDNYTLTVSIASISQPTSSTLLFTMTDSTTRGPFTLPVSTFQDRGAWTPSTPYLANDTFIANGSLYRVLVNHTSGATFSPTANDGAGHDYYSTMMSNPGNALPAGGAAGMFLKKSTNSNYSVSWAFPLPNGGTQNKVLAKLSNSDQDFGWITLGATMVSFTGSTASGLVSTTVSDALEELETNIKAVSSASKTHLDALTDVDVIEGSGIDGKYLKWNNTSSKWIADSPVPSFTDTIQFVIDGGSLPITTGMKGYVSVPFNATISEVKLLADQGGTITIDIYKCTYSDFDAGSTHPVSGDSICASAKATITSPSKKYFDVFMSGWTKSITAGDVLAFNVDTAGTIPAIQRLTICLSVTR